MFNKTKKKSVLAGDTPRRVKFDGELYSRNKQLVKVNPHGTLQLQEELEVVEKYLKPVEPNN